MHVRSIALFNNSPLCGSTFIVPFKFFQNVYLEAIREHLVDRHCPRLADSEVVDEGAEDRCLEQERGDDSGHRPEARKEIRKHRRSQYGSERLGCVWVLDSHGQTKTIPRAVSVEFDEKILYEALFTTG